MKTPQTPEALFQLLYNLVQVREKMNSFVPRALAACGQLSVSDPRNRRLTNLDNAD